MMISRNILWVVLCLGMVSSIEMASRRTVTPRETIKTGAQTRVQDLIKATEDRSAAPRQSTGRSSATATASRGTDGSSPDFLNNSTLDNSFSTAPSQSTGRSSATAMPTPSTPDFFSGSKPLDVNATIPAIEAPTARTSANETGFPDTANIPTAFERDPNSQDFVPDPRKASAQPSSSGIEMSPDADIPPAKPTGDLGTGIFAKQSVKSNSDTTQTVQDVYQSPSKRLGALETHVAGLEKLIQLHDTPALDATNKQSLKTEIDRRLAQVKAIHEQQKSDDSFRASLSSTSRLPFTASKQKRLDTLGEKIEALATKTDKAKKDAAADSTAATWAKKLFARKTIDKSFINREVLSIMHSYDLSKPEQQQAALKTLIKHLSALTELVNSQKISETKKTALTTMINDYTNASAKGLAAQEQKVDEIFAEVDKLSTPQGLSLKRLAAKLNGCTSWSQFKAKKAFDSQLAHLDIHGLASEINASKDPAKTLEQYFEQFQKPVTAEQIKSFEELKQDLLNLKEKSAAEKARLTAETLKAEWDKYERDFAEYKAEKEAFDVETSTYKSLMERYLRNPQSMKEPQEPTIPAILEREAPKRPKGKKPTEAEIAALKQSEESFKEIDPAQFAKKGPLQKFKQLTLAIENKWVRRTVITAAFLLTTAVVAGIVLASHGAALGAIVVPVAGMIADAGAAVVVAKATFKKADAATGNKLSKGIVTVVDKTKGAVIGTAKDAINAGEKGQLIRRSAKAEQLTDAIVKKALASAAIIPLASEPKTKKPLSTLEKKAAEQAKLEAAMAAQEAQPATIEEVD